MAHQNFIPRPEGDLDAWEATFSAGLAELAPALGYTPDEIAPVRTDIADHHRDYQAADVAQKKARAANAAKKSSREKSEASVRAMAARIKTNPAYTEAIGQRLGIIGPESSFDPTTAKPTLKLRPVGQDVEVSFDKPRPIAALLLKSRRGAETAFTFLAVDTESPYTDSRPNLVPGQAELREYQGMYYDDDHETGLPSDIVRISITR